MGGARHRRPARGLPLDGVLARSVAQRGALAGPVLQRYVIKPAVAVQGEQFHAQVKQANGSFRANDGVVLAAGPDDTPLRVSEDGQMAIEDTNLSQRQAKVFYATKAVVDASVKALKAHDSRILLYIERENAITVTDSDDNEVKLHRVLPSRVLASGAAHTARTMGMGLTVAQVCDAVAREIIGHDPTNLLPNLAKDIGLDDVTMIHEYKVARWFAQRIRSNDEDAATEHVNDDHTSALTREQITKDYMAVMKESPGAAALIAHELGINAFADPRVGEAFASMSLGAPQADGLMDYGANPQRRRKPLAETDDTDSGYVRDIWGTHYGAVVAESAGNKVTLENYGRQGEDPTNVENDPIYYFQMYGPVGKTSQTWHGQWTSGANPVINPITMVYG